MSWLPRLCRRRRTPPPPLTEADMAALRERTEDGLAQAQAQDAEVAALADRHRKHRERNHFGDLFLAVIEGRPRDV